MSPYSVLQEVAGRSVAPFAFSDGPASRGGFIRRRCPPRGHRGVEMRRAQIPLFAEWAATMAAAYQSLQTQALQRENLTPAHTALSLYLPQVGCVARELMR